MAIQIQLRRGTASQWTTANTLLAQGEIGIELDTNKIKLGDGVTVWNSLAYYVSGGISSVTATSPIASTGGATPVISMPAATASVSGYLTSTDWTTFNNKGSGTVTSVTGTSPISSSGGTTPAISLAAGYGDTQNPYASKTANYVLAAPNGSAGVPTFRAVVAADIPTLNQNTTGSAATLTTGRTISISGDMTYTSPSFDGSANVTAAGTLATVNTNVGSFTNASITVNGKGLITAASNGTALVTSVTGTSPVVSSGGTTPAISLASGYGDTQNPYASKTANYFLSAPNGSAGVPTFRAIVVDDIPTLNQNTTGTASNITATSNSTLTTLSSLSLPGSQVSGNISGNAANVTGTVAIANGGTGQTTQQAALTALSGTQTSGQYLRSNGTNTLLSAIQAADVPTLNQNTTGSAASLSATLSIASGGTGQTTASAGFNALSPITSTGDLIIGNGTNSATRLAIGTNGYVLTSNGTTASWAAAGSGSGTVTSVAATVPNFLSISGSPITTSGTLAITLSGTALPVANGGTGATTLAGASITTYSGTETLTNKRIDPRVVSTTSASSLTPSIATADVYAYTALAANLTINAPTGTPVDGDKLIFRLLDNGTTRTLTWDATYTVIGVTLPTSTTANKTSYIGCIYNANNTRWDVIAVTTQA